MVAFADAGVFVLAPLLFLGGLVAVFVMVGVFIFRVVRFVVRGLMGVGQTQVTYTPHGADSGRSRVCPNARCGRLNPPQARFCGRCGQSLIRTADVDAYG
ncbi:MAG: zinc ribbon domain-containing protein [Phycisphaerae bacterium]